MGRKSWVDRAVATGDWSQGEKKARKHLRKSNRQILERQRYYDREREKGIDELLARAAGEKAERAVEERLASETIVITLARAYETYQARGGNRALPERVLKELGETPVGDIDRATVEEVAR